MTGTQLIAAERKRQMKHKGFDAAHDDQHTDGSLLEAALRITRNVKDRIISAPPILDEFPEDDFEWPELLDMHVRRKYGAEWIGRLVIAGALIAAEIDRMQREKGQQRVNRIDYSRQLAKARARVRKLKRK